MKLPRNLDANPFAKKKKKKKEQTAEVPRRPPSTLQAEVLFEEQGESVIARYRGTTYILDTACPCGTPNAGEMWLCYLKDYGQTGIAMPYEYTGTVAEPVQETGETEPETVVPEPEEQPEQANECPEQYPNESENRTEASAHDSAELNRCRREIEELYDEIKKLRKELNTKQRNNTTLRQQISSIDPKRQSAQMEQLLLKCSNLETECISLRRECRRLKDIVEKYNADEERSARIQDDNFAVLTGESTIHCSAFRDGTYRVKFRIGSGELLFVPDNRGMVRCREKAAIIPGLKHFAYFDKVRVLDVSASDEMISIRLFKDGVGKSKTMQTA